MRRFRCSLSRITRELAGSVPDVAAGVSLDLGGGLGETGRVEPRIPGVDSSQHFNGGDQIIGGRAPCAQVQAIADGEGQRRTRAPLRDRRGLPAPDDFSQPAMREQRLPGPNRNLPQIALDEVQRAVELHMQRIASGGESLDILRDRGTDAMLREKGLACASRADGLPCVEIHRGRSIDRVAADVGHIDHETDG